MSEDRLSPDQVDDLTSGLIQGAYDAAMNYALGILSAPEPDDATRERWRREHEEREARAELLRARYENLRFGSPTLEAVRVLHRPSPGWIRGAWVCQGCDIDGYEAEPPEWPCRTASTLLGEGAS